MLRGIEVFGADRQGARGTTLGRPAEGPSLAIWARRYFPETAKGPKQKPPARDGRTMLPFTQGLLCAVARRENDFVRLPAEK
jgi:hypothetical protein